MLAWSNQALLSFSRPMLQRQQKQASEVNAKIKKLE